MIVWIGSYPRSGNTLTRILIRALFGVNTGSIYGDPYDIGANAELSALVGHQSNQPMNAGDLELANASDRIHFLKTHDPTPPWGKKIYIVRDARAAIISLRHYLNNYFEHPRTIPELVTGFGTGGDWSNHIAKWSGSASGNLLILRYEDLIVGEQLSESIADQLESFVGIRRRGLPKLEFERLKAIEPRFFRVGSNKPGIDEMESTCPNLFWHRHGQMMKHLNYVQEIPSIDYKKLIDEMSQAFVTLRKWAPMRLQPVTLPDGVPPAQIPG